MNSTKIDFTKIYTTTNHIYSLSLTQKKYYQYYHSTTFTNENICEISVLNRNNEVLKTRSYHLSESDYIDFLKNKSIPVGFYLCNVNNFLVFIQNTEDNQCKIANILQLETLNTLDEQICCIDVNVKDVKFTSHEGYVGLEYTSCLKRNCISKIYIINYDLDDDDPFAPILSIANWEIVEKEREKLRPREIFEPYTIFTPAEWCTIERYNFNHDDYLSFFATAKNTIQEKLERAIDPKLASDKYLLRLELNKIMGDYKKKNSNNSPSYKINDNNWLQNAAGTDDPEIMNDVFWNLD